jgi:hypothetical protein
MNRVRISIIPLIVAFIAFGSIDTFDTGSTYREGGFHLTASLPGATSTYEDAALVITTRNCAEPKNANVSARLILLNDDRVTSRKIDLRNVGEGEYAIDKLWTDATVALIAVDGSYGKQTAGLIIGLDDDASFEGSGRWVGRLTNGFPTRLLDRNIRDADVEKAFRRLTD